jgi:hypothetical protein
MTAIIAAAATKTAGQIAHEQRNAAAKATAQAARAERIAGHEQRNAASHDAAVTRKVDRFLAHVERQNQASIDAAAARAARDAEVEEALLIDATMAFAQAIEGRYGITANDNAAIAKAA